MSQILDPSTNAPVAPAPAENFIFHTRSYYNNSGLRIEEAIVVDGAFPKEMPRFVAHVRVRLRLPIKGKPEGPVAHEQPLEVPIDAANIVEAYAKASETIQAEADRFQKNFEASLAAQAAKHLEKQKEKGKGKGKKG